LEQRTYKGSLIVQLEHAKVSKHLAFLWVSVLLTSHCSIIVQVVVSIRNDYSDLAKAVTTSLHVVVVDGPCILERIVSPDCVDVCVEEALTVRARVVGS
jgi:1,4-dihydroxy-2-naphthoate octaprenyltransferase